MATIEFADRSAATRTPQAADATRTLTRAAMAARRAPSIFNSQPWRWRIAGDTAELRADRQRQLPVVDPDGRLLTLSCGAALHHARVALAGAGATAEVSRLPEPTDPDLMACVRFTGTGAAAPAAIRAQQAIALRRTDRRPFAEVAVPAEAIGELRVAAEREGAHLHVLRPGDPDDVVALAPAATRAAAVEFADPAYRAELDTWINRPDARGDGVPAATADSHDMRPVPARDFTPGAPVAGGEPVDRHARYAILFTDDDTPLSWLRAGEALSATLLTATMLRLATSPISDVIEVPATRRVLRELLGGLGHPMIALRIGVPADAPPPPAAPRRPTDEIIDTT
jgi:nitroreductase